MPLALHHTQFISFLTFLQTNMDGQLNMCLMAAEMFRAPLEISLPFPQVNISLVAEFTNK